MFSIEGAALGSHGGVRSGTVDLIKRTIRYTTCVPASKISHTTQQSVRSSFFHEKDENYLGRGSRGCWLEGQGVGAWGARYVRVGADALLERQTVTRKFGWPLPRGLVWGEREWRFSVRSARFFFQVHSR